MITEKWFNGNENNLKDVTFIRTEVFIKEQKIDEIEEFDGTDQKYNSKILVLYNDNKPFATGRLIEIGEKLFIGRVAILKEYRGLNYGIILLEKLIEKAKTEFNHKEIFIHAQSYTKAFYEKVGFISFGEEFLEANIPHLHMKINL
ncbi:MAG: GNAT family N-acetyltransferase [Eubacteriales bacterium]|nr:GNAT family N-acetyltransferase [Eubacteriales bacterium]